MEILSLSELNAQTRAIWEKQERAAFDAHFPNAFHCSSMFSAWLARAELHPCHINIHDTKDTTTGEIVYAKN